jgi:hypothetical protein
MFRNGENAKNCRLGILTSRYCSAKSSFLQSVYSGTIISANAEESLEYPLRDTLALFTLQAESTQ